MTYATGNSVNVEFKHDFRAADGSSPLDEKKVDEIVSTAIAHFEKSAPLVAPMAPAGWGRRDRRMGRYSVTLSIENDPNGLTVSFGANKSALKTESRSTLGDNNVNRLGQPHTLGGSDELFLADLRAYLH